MNIEELKNYLIQNPPQQKGDYDRIGRKLGYSAEAVRYHCRKLGLILNHNSQKEVSDMARKYVREEMREVVTEKSWNALEQDKSVRLDLSPFYGKTLKFGVVSDTHLCSKHQQVSELKTAYKVFDKEKVEFVVHAGDITEGNGNHYPGQIQELFLYTFDDQVRYVITEYPVLKNGKPTYFITGDHDLDWYKMGGRDIGEAITDKRPDMIYCGQVGAYLTINGGRKFIYLHHPRGGAAYAKSYKAQKWIEAVSPDNKPQIYINGHYHSICMYGFFRNVHWLATGCLQSQTPFLTAQGTEVVNAFCVITLYLDEKGSITRFIPNYYYLYVPRKNDYPHFEFQKVISDNEVKIKEV